MSWFSTILTDLRGFDFSNVTSYTGMFGTTATNMSNNAPFLASQKIYVKNATDQSWIINNVGANASITLNKNGNLTTANVLIRT